MKRLISVIALILAAFLLLSACNKTPDTPISDKEAKDIISSYSPGAVILECTYMETIPAYVIEFKTFHATYEGVVNAYTGNITAISLKTEEEEAPMFEEEEEPEEKFLSIDDALVIAVSHSKARGTATVIRRSLDRENKTFDIVFRSGSAEYSYIIDAVTGEVISSNVLMDS